MLDTELAPGGQAIGSRSPLPADCFSRPRERLPAAATPRTTRGIGAAKITSVRGRRAPEL
jgi:hypothetical protein